MTATAENPYDVAVVGAGPAGLAATASLAAEGLRVVCIAPDHPPPWPNTYGIWLDELAEVDLADCAAATWQTARVDLGRDRGHALDRTYALIDNDRLRETLVGRAEAHDVDWQTGVVVDAEPRGEAAPGVVDLRTRSGDPLAARLVVDATGHSRGLSQTKPAGSPGYQTAYGIVARCDGPPTEPGTMTLMDYRSGHLPDAEANDGPPTFLYAMRREPGLWLLEETVLVARPRVSFDLLKRRLESRLAHRGIDVGEVVETERVAIPMGGELPSPDPAGGLLPFGAAARMVHPATGYMVGRTLAAAAPMARAVADALDAAADGEAHRGVSKGWEAIWPPELVRTRELCTFGMESLLSMGAEQTRQFFDAFFSLPQYAWSDYLSGSASPLRVARTMLEVFASASLEVKGRLTRSAFSSDARRLVRGLTR